MASEQLLLREIEELRRREASYRDGLRDRLEAAARLRGYTRRLMATLRAPATQFGDALFTEIAALSTEALGVTRASVWMVDRAHGVLACRHLMSPDERREEAIEIPLARVATYVGAVSQEVIAVDDVASDPRTAELLEYCRARGIGALLDIPILLDGRLEGVVCHEHVGPARAWTDGEFDFAIGIGNLVTIRIEAERRHAAQDHAREVDARYRHLVDTLPVGIYSIDAATSRLTYVSPAVEALAGRPASELLTDGLTGWLASVAEPDRALVRERMRGGRGRHLRELNYRLTRPDGSAVWIRDLCAIVRDVTGEPVAYQGTLENITAERDADGLRHEAERRYRELLAHVELIGVVLAPDGKVVDVNACFERTLGIARDAIVGRDWFAAVVAEEERDARRAVFEREVADDALSARSENTIRSPGRGPRQVLWARAMLYDGHGAVSGVAALGLDVTERLRLEAELVEQRKLESLGRMAASLAHDFNNVLTILSLALSAQSDAAAVGEALAHARELVASLLGYARREPLAAAALEPDRTIHDLAPMLATVVGSDLSLELALHGGGVSVQLSATELRQLVINLVTNAAEATRGHGHTIRVTSGVVVEELPREAPRALYQLVVADDGRGMDAETLARAFEPFFTTKHVGSGTGIGLATCQAIAARAGGGISAESSVGQGTTFRVTLPIAGAAERATEEVGASAPAAARGRARPETHGGRARSQLLLVEDNPTLGTIVARELGAASYQVEVASSVAEALAAIERTQFEIVVTDLNLSDGRGERVIAAVRARSSSTAIVVSSADHRELQGADELVSKPFTGSELRAAVARAREARAAM